MEKAHMNYQGGGIGMLMLAKLGMGVQNWPKNARVINGCLLGAGFAHHSQFFQDQNKALSKALRDNNKASKSSFQLTFCRIFQKIKLFQCL